MKPGRVTSALVLAMCTAGEVLACIAPWIHGRGYNPNASIVYDFDDGFIFLQQCLAAGLEMWNGVPGIRIVSAQEAGTEANLQIRLGEWSAVPDAEWILDGERSSDGYVVRSEIYFANNIDRTTGADCGRLQRLAAHEMGHALGLDQMRVPGVGPRDTIMYGGDPGRPWGGLDDLPNGPTDCDRDGAKNAQTFKGPEDRDPPDYRCLNGDSYTGDGCSICHRFITSGVRNIKPAVDIRGNWNGSMHRAPLNGRLDLHTMDLDGSVWRVDYFVNGSRFWTTTTPPFSMPFSGVQPGTFDVQVAAYDTADEYTLSAPVQIRVCGAPPPVPGIGGHVNGRTAAIGWTATPMTTHYVLEVGSGRGMANIAVLTIPGLSFVYPNAAPGVYYARVRSANPCGGSVPSNELVLTVR
jgi:hypothetical protein